MICQVIANCLARKENGEPFTTEDFMPITESELEQQSPNDQVISFLEKLAVSDNGAA